uniref:EGF-like domain-containing protein n=1 Tax=Chromera velia CCMP2878 TaxID=1169474 RepID=A0A0G4HB05_9ALVE|eukprot:Cvel_6098.t1-p1 / transcript=Cvel_6098.t1 / gene=Cvel_6098 / organism=Chromera_velia_CCMP2878 / gene_product=Fibrillin-1, putative / transcript_product=Fibrillin-1, putative / location=Cvel_scaffold294:2974-15422(-) / protein_length=1724 / sequence_SO=supercontig / SO=protein_coding / is_pseudo=false
MYRSDSVRAPSWRVAMRSPIRSPVCSLLVASVLLGVQTGVITSAPSPPWRDDFDGSSLNTSIWTPEITDPGISSYSVSGGSLLVSSTGLCNLDATRAGAPLIRTDAPGGLAGNWTARFKLSSDNGNNFKAGLHVYDTYGGVGFFYLGSRTWGPDRASLSRLTPYGGGGYSVNTPVQNTYVEYAMAHKGSGEYDGYWHNGSDWEFLGSYTTTFAVYIGLFASTDAAGMDAHFDYFQLDFYFEDLEECSGATHNCDGNATCTNTNGSFTCSCDPGFVGNGVSCVPDDDECTLSTDDCHGNASCSNSIGSFGCGCNTGFSGDGVVCTDDDECLLSVHNCHSEGACANSEGSFSCGCISGFSGDGVSSCIGPFVSQSREGGAGGAEAQAFALLLSRFEECVAMLPLEEQIGVLTGVLEDTLATTPTFPDNDAAALALLSLLDGIGDLISELSSSGTTVEVHSSKMRMLVSTFDVATTVFSVEIQSLSVLLELNNANELQGTGVSGGFSARSPLTWSSLLGAMDRSERHFAEGQEGEEGQRSLVLLTTVDNPHPYAAGRTREGGFLLEGATRFVRVQARQRRQVLGSGRVPKLTLSSFGSGSSRAQGGRSGGRRRLAEVVDSAEQLEVPVDEAKETAGALRIRAQGPDASAMLQQRGLLESSWEDLQLGLRGGEWVLECAQLDVQQELWTNAGCRFFLSEAEGEWWCACALRSLDTTLMAVQRYVPPPRKAPESGETRSARHTEVNGLEDSVLVLWNWLLIFSILCGVAYLYLYAIRAERDLSPHLASLDPQGRQKALLEKQSQAATDKVAAAGLSKTSVTKEVFDSERHRRRLGVFFTPRRVVGFLEARAWMSKRAHRESKGGGQTTSDSTVRHGILGRLRALVSQSPCAVCCRRLLLREETLAFVDARQLSRLRELNRLKLSAKMRGYLDGGAARQRLMWQQLDAELASRKYDMGLQFKSQAWEAEEGRKNFLLPSETWLTSVATFTTAQTFQSSSADGEEEEHEEANREGEMETKNRSVSMSSDLSSSDWNSSEEGDMRAPVSPAPKSFRPVGMVEREISPVAAPSESLVSRSPVSLPPSPLLRPPRWADKSPAGSFMTQLRALRESVLKNISPSSSRRVKETPEASLRKLALGERKISPRKRFSIGSGDWRVMENLTHLKYMLAARHDNVEKEKGSDNAEEDELKEEEVHRTAEEKVEEEDDEFSPLVRVRRGPNRSPRLNWTQKPFKGSRFFPGEADSVPSAPPSPAPSPPVDSRSPPPTPSAALRSSPASGTEQDSPEKLKRQKSGKKTRMMLDAIQHQRSRIFKTLDTFDEREAPPRWRAKMAIVAPEGLSHAGRLPLRKSLDTGHVVLRIFHRPHVWLLMDVSPVTETLLWILRLAGTFCLCLILNAATVLVGETDEFHTAHTPVTLTTAPRQFHLPSSLDLFSFAPAAAVKSLISFLALLLVVGSLLRPLCARVWSEESLFEDLHVVRQSPSDPSEEGERTDQSPLGRLSLPVGAEGRDRSERPFSAPDRKSTHKETRRSSLARAETKLAEEFSSGRLLYYNFGEAMSIRARPVRLPRAECAHRFVSRRNLEVVVQKLLWVACGVAALVYLSLLAVATAEWKASRESANREEWGGLRGNQFCSRRPSVVLSEHSVGILIFFLLEILWCCLLSLCRAMLLRLSLRSGLVRRFLNCFPRAAMFSDLHPEAEVKFGKDVVKALDAVPASNWIVPPERFDWLVD